jgi:hypothetical protein
MFIVEVQVFGDEKWYGNGLEFATRAEADAYAVDLKSRWLAVNDTRVVEQGGDR